MTQTPTDMLKEFNLKFGYPVPESPGLITDQQRCLRLSLMYEELLELFDAMGKKDLLGIADGIGDLLYVVYGTAVEYGLNADAILAEVHRSNMTKKPGNYNTLGKLIKNKDYSPPNLHPYIA